MSIQCEENEIFVDCPNCKMKQKSKDCKTEFDGNIKNGHDGNKIDLSVMLEVLKNVFKDKRVD